MFWELRLFGVRLKCDLISDKRYTSLRVRPIDLYLTWDDPLCDCWAKMVSGRPGITTERIWLRQCRAYDYAHDPKL